MLRIPLTSYIITFKLAVIIFNCSKATVWEMVLNGERFLTAGSAIESWSHAALAGTSAHRVCP